MAEKLKDLDKLAIIYPLLFILVVAGVFVGYRSPAKAEEQAANAGQLYALVLPTATNYRNVSADQVTVADAAATVANMSNLSVYGQATSNADTVRIKEELGQTDETVISKVNESANSKAFVTYIVLEGDNVDSIVGKFNGMVSSTTIRWANGLKNTEVTPGTSLLIPVTNGIIYTVKEGDTVDALIGKYGSDTESIAYYNDEVIDETLPVGERILLPNGVLPEKERPEYVAPVAVSRPSSGGSYGGSWSNAGVMAAGNRYAYGNCTWYAYNRRVALGLPVGSFWGNANTWDIAARAAGLLVDGTPTPGAIFVQKSGYFGHVGIVESVDWASGTMLVSDMNNYAHNGYGRSSSWVTSINGFASAYIH
jgi:surface antigen